MIHTTGMIVNMDGKVRYDGPISRVWFSPFELEIRNEKPLISAGNEVAIELAVGEYARRFVGLVVEVQRSMPFSDEWYTVVEIDGVETE